MAANSIEHQAEIPLANQSRLWFPKGVAPFGELNLIRIDHTRRKASGRPSEISNVLKRRGPEIVHDAWAGSAWLQEEIGVEGALAFERMTNYDTVGKILDRDIIDAAFFPHKKTAWFAVQPPLDELEDGSGLHRGLGPRLESEQVIGFANATHDVSGNFIQRAVKRARYPEKVYAAVSNIAIYPNYYQGQKIGAALLYASLGMFRPEQRTTAYVASLNSGLRAKLLDELYYEETGSQTRKDLVPDFSFKEVRLEAPSVGGVRTLLAARFPWLKEAVAVEPNGLDNYESFIQNGR